MRLSGAWWADSYDEAEAVVEVTRKAQEWASAEPRIEHCDVLRVWRPFPDRPLWYSVEMDLTFRAEAKVEQQTLWTDAA